MVVTEKKVTMTDAGEKATLIKEYHITLDMAKELAMVERIEYYITLDMAKELSMVERNEKLCDYYLAKHK